MWPKYLPQRYLKIDNEYENYIHPWQKRNEQQSKWKNVRIRKKIPPGVKKTNRRKRAIEKKG